MLLVRDPESELAHQRDTWWAFDRAMQNAMTREGIREGFNSATLLGDIFSI